jgi:hypothetical protein
VEVAVRPESCVVVGYLGYFFSVAWISIRFKVEFYFFLFRSSRTALLNSTPQLLARDCRAVAQGAQPGPGELPMDAAA